MLNLPSAASGLALMFMSATAFGQSYTFAPLDAPGDSVVGTFPRGINNLGAVSGAFQDGSSGVGHHGFLFSGGNFTPIDNPSAQQGGTDAWGLNDQGSVAGSYFQSTAGYRGFVYTGSSFTAVDDPLAAHGTQAVDVSAAGIITGQYLDASFGTHGFRETAGKFATVDAFQALPGTTHITGINGQGTISGYYTDANGTRGFIDVTGDIYIPINHPAAPNATYVTGVNSSNWVTGYYTDSTGAHGFVYGGGVFTPINDPKATGDSFANGLNDRGVVTGYSIVNGMARGYIATPTTTPARADDFAERMGINTHLSFSSQGYSNLTVVINALKYLGVRYLRDSPVKTSLQPWTTVAQATGVKFDAYLPSSSKSDVQATLNYMPSLANAGLLNFIEGGNEEDTATPQSLGNTLASTAQFQQQVYQMGQSLHLPVINMSFGTGWTAANNWAGNYDQVGDLSAYCDYANAHVFPEPAIGQPDATLQDLIRDAHMAASQRPVINTEMGWDGRTAEGAVAGQLLQGVMDAMLSGALKTYIYALFDEAGITFGIMNTDGTPKPEGAAFHNLMTLLADAGTTAKTFTPQSLPYALSSTSDGERSYLMQKSDGSYWLAVWNESLVGTHTLTVNLPTAAQQIKVYDPIFNLQTIQSLNKASAVSVNMTGRTLLIDITPASTAPPPPPPNTITSSASNTTITANAGTTAISVYGTGDTINGGAGTYTLIALKGGNTINTGAGNATIQLGGASNKVSLGTGNATINAGGSNNTFAFGAPGIGQTDIYGYILSQGATLDFRTLLAGTQWNGNASTVGNFLKVNTVGSSAVITVNASGLTGGAAYPVATLHGYAYLTLQALLTHSTI